MSFCVVPCSAFARRALLVGDRDVEREQPRRGGVDGHRGVHLDDRDVVEQRAHVAEMGDRHADLADLAAREHVVAVVAGLGRQIEGDRQAGLPLGEVLPVKRVQLARVRVPRIGAEDPGFVAHERYPPGVGLSFPDRAPNRVAVQYGCLARFWSPWPQPSRRAHAATRRAPVPRRATPRARCGGTRHRRSCETSRRRARPRPQERADRTSK